MNCFCKLGMCFLVILNLAFMICGAGMIVGGIMLRSNSETIGGDYFPMLDDKILPLMSNVGITPSFTLQEVLEMIATVLTVTGGIIGGATFVGFCGACCKLRPFLILYAVIVTVVSGAEIFAVYYILELKSEVNDTVKGTLLGLLVAYEGNVGGLVTMAWNSLFVMFKCCGVNRQSVIDDFEASVWNATRGADIIPGYCCKGATYLSGSQLSGEPCTTAPTASTSYYESGCYTAIEESIEQYSNIFMYVCFGVLGVEAAAVVCSCCMTYQISTDLKTEKYRNFSRRKVNPNINT